AFAMAKPFGFSVNCDLIAGLAEENAEDFSRSLDEAIVLSPENITVHTLCLKKGARLKEETSRLAEGELAEMIALSRGKLTAAGYEPYYLYRQKYMAGAHENVGWTKKGYASVYNIDVMEESADNLAVGANAITKKVFLGEGRIERIGSPKDIPSYLAKTEKLIEEKNALFGRA
ncbi:MAG: coproporphyrinogen dehydrogenase HemZ, partial [Candidatus Gallimonas sp.]